MYPMVGKGKRDVVKPACSQKGFTIAAIPEGTEWELVSMPQMNVESHGSLVSFPAGSKGHKQGVMEGPMDFIQACAAEDEKWTWSPLYLLLRDYSLLSTRLPRPWKHTAEEWDSVREFIATNQATKIEYHGHPPPIVAVLDFTWRFHFDECIENVELSKLRDRLEDASKEKEFVNNLLRLQEIMMSMWDGWSERKIQEQQILANDVASFKATSESPGHQEVIKRICSHFVGIAHCVMEDMAAFDSQQFKDMWIGGHLKSEQEMLIEKWRVILGDTIEEKLHTYGFNI